MCEETSDPIYLFRIRLNRLRDALRATSSSTKIGYDFLPRHIMNTTKAIKEGLFVP